MSPETGNIHFNNSEASGSAKNKEVSTWFQKLINNRLLPLPSHTPIDIGIPPIVSGIWRKIGDFSKQSVHLPILRATSLPILTGPAKHSKVWGRLLDLPLLRPRRKQRNRLSNTSQTHNAEQPYQIEKPITSIYPDYEYSEDTDKIEVDVNTGEFPEPATSTKPEILQMFSDITDIPREEDRFDLYGEPALREQLETIKHISEGRLFDNTAGNEIVQRPIIKEKPLHSADNINRQLNESSASGFSKYIVKKTEKAVDSNIIGIHDEKSISKESQEFNEIHQPYFKRTRYNEDIPQRYSVHPQPVYNIRETDSVSIPYIDVSDSKQDEVIPAIKNREQTVTDYIPGLPDAERLPENDMKLNIPLSKERQPVRSEQLSTDVQRNIPLTQSPSILQKAYLKIKDSVITPGIKALQLTYKKDSLPAEKGSKSITLPALKQGDVIHSISPVEHIEPVNDAVITGRIVPDTVEDKTVMELLSTTSDIENQKNVNDEKLSYDQKTDTQEPIGSVLSMSPLIKYWVETPSAQKTVNKTGKIPEKIIKRFPFTKPLGKISALKPVIARKSETATSKPAYTDITYSPVYMQEKYDEKTGIPESQVPQNIQKQSDAPFTKDINNQIMDKKSKEPDKQTHGEGYRSLELLFTNNNEAGKTEDAFYKTGTSLPPVPLDSAHNEQPIKEPINLLERYLADRRISGQKKDDIDNINGPLPENPTHMTGDSLSREISISRSAATDESDIDAARNSETEQPDLDAIAREVYIILRKRIIRERERAFGLS